MPFARRLFQVFWWLERYIDPGVVSSQNRYAELLKSYVRPDSIWLDVGCGRELLPDWIPAQVELLQTARFVAGLDPDQPSIKENHQIRSLLAGDLDNLPFRDVSFNLITANMVVEHLKDPKRGLLEIRRVLQNGGYFIYHTPNRRFYKTKIASFIPQWIKNQVVQLSENRHEEDIFPTHYRMNDLQSIHAIAQSCGFRLAECHALNTSSAGSIVLLGPFVVLDLAYRRLLRWEALRQFRSNFIVVLQKEF